ncbi:MAG: hypothetical protein LIR50_14975 [Bacillota bacterium]|nr:hypothetical protein [Bacillota bacterium]
MGNFVTQKMESLTEEELKQCFKEIQEYREKGMMSGDTLVRQIRRELAIKTGDKSWDCDCRVVVVPEILYEIARRYCSKER